jgi:structure-specific recognition protein 1
LVVPRGKYTIDFYQKNLRFHGQTYNFIIDYKNIMKGFLLPMENESQVSIILQLHKDKPIYQGQTLYRNIVIQVKKDIDVEVKTRVKDKDKEKNPNLAQIKEEYSGPLFQVLMDVIKSTAQISLIAPDSKDFKSKNGQSCVKCGVKAQPGWLYFLKRSLIFIPKPVLYFKMD